MAAFATVAEFNLRTGMAVEVARGAALLDDVSAEIRGYVDQDIEATLGRQDEFAEHPYKKFIEVSQIPVTSVTSVTIDGVAFIDFEWDREQGYIVKTAGTAWDEGPIVVTYDSGYADTTDEFALVRSICIEAAARALGGPQDTFGIDVPELRGSPYAIFLTEGEQHRLDRLKRLVTA